MHKFGPQHNFLYKSEIEVLESVLRSKINHQTRNMYLDVYWGTRIHKCSTTDLKLRIKSWCRFNAGTVIVRSLVGSPNSD